MTTAIHLAGPDDAVTALALMQRSHAERALPHDDAHRENVIAPLLDGSPLGAVWLIGPARAPLGYVMISFGWSVDLGGMIGWVEDIYIRPSVRKRGIGTEVLHAVAVTLGRADLRALHVRIAVGDDALARFCAKAGFETDQTLRVMTDMM
ncbi:GNAT family N-acetyltransferase [Yoonia sp.]|uniref:GNAT family N-acetyltransferase n=1 Tax=Yoonia sp. TaxID=2212373 RepID=UPI0019F80929|nr:GNAT family N-acetyltransferase [Yoonia sp.]MBE0414846.1 GNAT family N-acetyltransferase [Yoonia sp.]